MFRRLSSFAVLLLLSFASGQPAATLKPDPLDAPAPTSVREAARAAERVKDGAHHHHHPGYTHRDAGRDEDTPAARPTPTPTPKAQEHHH